MTDKHASTRLPAPPTIVRNFILEILKSGEPMKRNELVARVRRLAPQKGFVLEIDSAIPTVKKALAILVDEGHIVSPRIGYWKIQQAAADVASPRAVAPSILVEVNSEALKNTNLDTVNLTDSETLPTRLKVVRQIGEGQQCIYVYYHDAHAELARRNGHSAWECKIGWTVGEPDARVIGQGALTCFPRPPIIGLLIRTDHGRNVEHILHSALTIAGKRVEGGGGSEWFITSPERIEQWFDAFLRDLSLLN